MARNRSFRILLITQAVCLASALALVGGCDSKSDTSQNDDSKIRHLADNDSALSVESLPRTRPEKQLDQAEQTRILDSIEQDIKAKNYGVAENALKDHLHDHPRSARAVAMTGHIAFAKGEPEQAIKLLERAARITRRFGGQSGETSSSSYEEQAAEFMAASDQWQRAIDRFRDLALDSPNEDRIRRKLADLLNSRGYRFEGNEHVREMCLRSGATPRELQGLASPVRSYTGLSEKPDVNDRDSILQLGELNAARGLYGEGDIDDAIALYEQSELVARRDLEAMAFYGQLLIESGRSKEFQQLLAKTNTTIQPYPAYWMALGRWAIMRDDPAAAVRCYAEAVLREPGDVQANQRLAEALHASNKTELAEKFESRVKQIGEILSLVKTLAAQSTPDSDLIDEVATKLSALSREREAIAWRQLAILQSDSADDAMKELNERKKQLLETQDQEMDESVRQEILCGLKLGEYSMANLDLEIRALRLGG